MFMASTEPYPQRHYNGHSKPNGDVDVHHLSGHLWCAEIGISQGIHKVKGHTLAPVLLITVNKQQTGSLQCAHLLNNNDIIQQ